MKQEHSESANLRRDNCNLNRNPNVTWVGSAQKIISSWWPHNTPVRKKHQRSSTASRVFFKQIERQTEKNAGVKRTLSGGGDKSIWHFLYENGNVTTTLQSYSHSSITRQPSKITGPHADKFAWLSGVRMFWFLSFISASFWLGDNCGN